MTESIVKFTKENILKTLSIPLVIGFVGNLILNNYLSQFGQSDSNLVQTKLLFVGGFFFLVCLVFIVVLLMFLHTDNVSSNSFLTVITNFIVKTVVFTPVFYSIFMAEFSDEEYFLLTWKISANRILLLNYSSLVTFIVLMICWKYARSPKDKTDKSIRRLWIFLSIIVFVTSIICSYLLYKNEIAYDHVLSFFSLIAIMVFGFYLGLWVKSKDKKEESEYGSGLFSHEAKMLRLDVVILIMYFVAIVFLSVNKYSILVYPHISYKYGGGNIYATTVFKKDGSELVGKIINKNADQIFLLDSTNRVYYIQNDDILKTYAIPK